MNILKRSGKPMKKSDIIRNVILVISVIVFLYALINLIVIFVNYKIGDKQYSKVKSEVFDSENAVAPEVLVSDDVLADVKIEKEYKFLKYDHAALLAINPQAQGYIDMPGIGFSYPIALGADNEYYLNHTIEGSVHSYGCLFIDYRQTDGFKGRNPIIYGHNMKSGAMLAGLNKYLKADFYADKYNQFFYFYCGEGVYVYQIFSVYITDATDKETYKFTYDTDKEYADYIEYVAGKSRYPTGVSVDASDEIMTLSTCYDDKTARIIVHAKRLK